MKKLNSRAQEARSSTVPLVGLLAESRESIVWYVFYLFYGSGEVKSHMKSGDRRSRVSCRQICEELCVVRGTRG